MDKMPLKAKMYLSFIYVLTLISLCIFINNGSLRIYDVDYKGAIFFIIFIIFTESFVVILKDVAFSTGFAPTLACYILYGPAIAIIVTLIGFSFRVLKSNGKYIYILNTPIYKTLYNYCTFILLIIYSNYFCMLSGGNLIFDTTNNIFTYLPQLFIFCLVYFIINTSMIAALFSCLTNKNFFFVFAKQMRMILISNLAMAPFGLIIAYLYYTNSIVGVFMFLCPVMLAKFTFLLYAESKEKYVQTIDVLTRAIEARDNYTEGHSQRVADISGSIAKEMKYSEWKREQLKIAALMHDVGKIGIDDAILNKPGKLTDEEYDVIKRHPVIGYNILKDVKDLEPVLDLVKYHHERYDGKGYPEGKTVDELGIDVFIIQLADSIDAMSTDRPYRKALSEGEIVSELIRCCGTQFHPKVVEAYLKTKGIDMQTLIREKEEAEKKGDCLCS